MNLIYRSIYEAKVENNQAIESKTYLLNLFQDFKKINFTVSDQLILEQINEDKRGLVNGYDEGVVSRSYFLFFVTTPPDLRKYYWLIVKRTIGIEWIFFCVTRSERTKYLKTYDLFY